jgi:hypothetical protein
MRKVVWVYCNVFERLGVCKIWLIQLASRAMAPFCADGEMSHRLQYRMQTPQNESAEWLVHG